jgi:hypothetical protein
MEGDERRSGGALETYMILSMGERPWSEVVLTTDSDDIEDCLKGCRAAKAGVEGPVLKCQSTWKGSSCKRLEHALTTMGRQGIV